MGSFFEERSQVNSDSCAHSHVFYQPTAAHLLCDNDWFLSRRWLLATSFISLFVLLWLNDVRVEPALEKTGDISSSGPNTKNTSRFSLASHHQPSNAHVNEVNGRLLHKDHLHNRAVEPSSSGKVSLLYLLKTPSVLHPM